MGKPISHVLHKFLSARRILTEIARRCEKNPSTFASELNPKVVQAKFALDDLEKLIIEAKKMGYGGEMDEILDDYFNSLREYPVEVESESVENLAALTANLMAKTAALADNTMRLIDSSDDQQLKEVKYMIRSELIPTAMRLLAIIDRRLGRDPGDESILQPT